MSKTDIPMSSQISSRHTGDKTIVFNNIYNIESASMIVKLNNVDSVVYTEIMLTHNDIHDHCQLTAHWLTTISFHSHGKHRIHKPKYFNLL